jgi:FAD/FMN-containing dehydrogenase
MEPADLDRLRGVLRGELATDAVTLTRVGHDGSHLVGRPSASVRPADAGDVARLVAWARRTRTPLVPRGGGTSLDGESVPADGAVSVDLSGWNSVAEVNPDELWARVGPGVINLDLQHALRPFGLFFPPNPGSWTTSTIGGNIGTNASGPRSFRYGATRAWVRELDVVLGTGATMHVGSKAPKRSVGPDLLSLLVGSEGTLGIVTEAIVRVAPIPPVRRGLVVALPEGVRLGALASRLARTPGTGVSAVEYLDRGCATALAEGRRPVGPGGSALLMLEVEADDDTSARARVERLGDALRKAGADGPTEEFADADELWTLRGESSVVLDERYGHRIREDVAVPTARVDALLVEVDRIAREESVPLFLFAHLGEGSLHPNYVVDPSTPAAERVRAALLDAALRHEGTISAEHGIGRLKVPYLSRELGPEGVRLLWEVKRACDPDGILNPGKLYPPGPG